MKDVEVIKAHNTLSPRARTNFEKRLRVAAYCRVSTDTEDQLNSYKSQVKYYPPAAGFPVRRSRCKGSSGVGSTPAERSFFR